MAKNLSCKVGEYESEGKTKGEYVNIGVILPGNDEGEFILLDPTINIAGCLQKQNMMNHKNSKPVRDSLLVSIYDNNNSAAQPVGTDNTFDDDVVF